MRPSRPPPAAAPLPALLTDTGAVVQCHGPGARPDGILRHRSREIGAGLATVEPCLAPDDFERLCRLAQACQGDEARQSCDAALQRVRELHDSVHRLAA